MRILIIEDDRKLCGLLSSMLAREGYTVDVAHEGDDGLRWMQERAHDLVLLDRMLPRLDGTTLLRIAREQGIHTPVLMVTALGGVEDRVEGLEGGADDYIVKPFSTRELIARIRAIGRRPREWSGSAEIAAGDLQFEPVDKVLRCNGREVSLSKREADLLTIFLRSAGKTLPRSTLLSYVWGPDACVEEGNLDSYVHYLRRHLGEVGSECSIATVRNTGYRMNCGDADAS